MNSRYLRMIEFFQQTKKKENKLRAIKEFDHLKAVTSQMKFYLNLDFKKFEQNFVILEAKKGIKFIKLCLSFI